MKPIDNHSAIGTGLKSLVYGQCTPLKHVSLALQQDSIGLRIPCTVWHLVAYELLLVALLALISVYFHLL